MKSIHYIKKYDLLNSSKFNHGKFAEDFKKDFIESLPESITLKIFDQKVKELHDKFSGISRKVQFGLDDGLWKFIYASIVVPTKIKLFPNTHNCIVNSKLQEIMSEMEETEVEVLTN